LPTHHSVLSSFHFWGSLKKHAEREHFQYDDAMKAKLCQWVQTQSLFRLCGNQMLYFSGTDDSVGLIDNYVEIQRVSPYSVLYWTSMSK
jgi:hypothetical protein